MTKKEIVKQISEKLGLTQLKTKEIVQKTFDAIIETLLAEGRIELRNFGVFEVKQRKARKARNPRTGERVDVEPKNVVTFKPGKEMEERVRQLKRVDDHKAPTLSLVPPDDDDDALADGEMEYQRNLDGRRGTPGGSAGGSIRSLSLCRVAVPVGMPARFRIGDRAGTRDLVRLAMSGTYGFVPAMFGKFGRSDR